MPAGVLFLPKEGYQMTRISVTTRVGDLFLSVNEQSSRSEVEQAIRQAAEGMTNKQLAMLKSMIAARLDQMERKSVQRTQANLDEIQGTARSKHELSTNGLPSFMGDLYDNEVSAEHRGQAQTRRSIELFREAVELLLG